LKKEELNKVTGIILNCAIEVHKNLRPGLLESVYETCLYKELMINNIKYMKQVSLPVLYKGEPLEVDYRIDILVEDEIIIELKDVDVLLPVHKAQLLTYIKLDNKKIGLFIDFSVPKLIDGYNRMINGFFE
jgi:GxxExxY protein